MEPTSRQRGAPRAIRHATHLVRAARVVMIDALQWVSTTHSPPPSSRLPQDREVIKFWILERSKCSWGYPSEPVFAEAEPLRSIFLLFPAEARQHSLTTDQHSTSPRSSDMPTFQHELMAGTVGGILGISVVYPLDTVKSRYGGDVADYRMAHRRACFFLKMRSNFFPRS